MQKNDKCYNKIFCSFKNDGEDCKELIKESFVDYLKIMKIRAKHLKNTAKRVNIKSNRYLLNLGGKNAKFTQ